MIEFTSSGYLRLLRDIRDTGRKICSFRDLEPTDESYVILRHDIDFSLPKALEMARLDVAAGVTSTFFFMVTAPYYNPLSEEGVEYVKEIAAMGHECGLHYDCSGFELLSATERQHRVALLAKTLEEVSGIPIKIIAQHKPGTSPIRQEFPGFINAYSPQYINDIAYLSDSRGMFRHTDVPGFFRQTPRSQLLIHPIWWNEVPMSRSEIMSEMLTTINDTFRELLSDELASIDNYLKVNSL